MEKVEISTSAQYLARGVQLVNTSGIRRFVWVPLFINIVVFSTLGWFAYGWLISWLDGFAVFRWASEIPVLGLLVSMLRGLIVAAMFAVAVFSLTLVSNLIAAPFNGLLAERVEAHLTGTPPPELSFKAMLRTIPKDIGAELHKLVYLALMLIGIGLLHLIPVINFIAPLLLMAFGAWMFAINYWSFPMGNHGIRFGAVRRFARTQRRAALGFGGVVAIVSTIPLLNFFVMPVAVAGATALWVEHFSDANLSINKPV